MDKYSKLKPPRQTPDNEICKCNGRPAIMLQPTLTHNPISCADCNLEVNLEQFNFDEKLVDEITNWRSFHDCFYKLWLDSGEFEEFAKEQLSKPDSGVNKRGLTLNDKINTFHECFYWWFVDNSASDYRQITNCPSCGGDIHSRQNKFGVDANICGHCKIIIGT